MSKSSRAARHPLCMEGLCEVTGEAPASVGVGLGGRPAQPPEETKNLRNADGSVQYGFTPGKYVTKGRSSSSSAKDKGDNL